MTSFSNRFSESPAVYKLGALIALLAPFLIYVGTAVNKIPENAGDSVAVKPSSTFISVAWIVNTLGLILIGLYSIIGTQVHKSSVRLEKIIAWLVLFLVVAYSVLCYAWTGQYKDSDTESCSKALRNSSWILGVASFTALLLLVFCRNLLSFKQTEDPVICTTLTFFLCSILAYTTFATYLNFSESQELYF